MAIRIIEGKIGSGKSYFAVNHIVKNYYIWDTDKLAWLPKELDGRVVDVYSNLDGFSLGHNLIDEITKAGGVVNFFNVDFQTQFIGQRKIIYLIDEAQSPQFFHRKFYNPQVFFFFQYHRHLGCDIYLLTQDINSLVRELKELPEFVVRVSPRIKSLTGEFRYKYMLGEESYKTVTLRPAQNIFALYKSQNQKEVEKIGSAPRRYALLFVLLVLAAYLIFRYGFIALFVPDNPLLKNAEAKTVPLHKELTKTVSSSVPVPVVNPSVLSYSPPLPDDKYIEVTISGMVRVPETGYSSVFFIDSQNREFNLTGFDFDNLCKCNSFARLKSGDSLQILDPPKGSKYRRIEKQTGTEGVLVVPAFPSVPS